MRRSWNSEEQIIAPPPEAQVAGFPYGQCESLFRPVLDTAD